MFVALVVAATGIVGSAPSAHADPVVPPESVAGVGVVPITDCSSSDDRYGFIGADGLLLYGGESVSATVYAVDAARQRLGQVGAPLTSVTYAQITVTPADWPGYAGIEVAITGSTESGSVFVDPADETCTTSADELPTAGAVDRLEPSLSTINPTRVFDSRLTELGGSGPLPATTWTRIDVGTRLQLPPGTTSVFANVTAVGARARGHVSVTGCSADYLPEAPPTTALLTVEAGDTVGNQAIIPVNDGLACVYTHAATDLVIDVTATIAGLAPSSLTSPTDPIRLAALDQGWSDRFLDTRESGVEPLAAGEARRILTTSAPAIVTMTVVRPDAAGHLMVFPCADGPGNTSALNYAAHDIRSATVVATPDAQGEVCASSLAATDLVGDHVAAISGDELVALPGARLADTRPAHSTVDAQHAGEGRIGPDSPLEVLVAGRGQVPLDARAAQIDVAIVGPAAAGHSTVYPCDAPRPTAATSNFAAGQTIANHTLVPLSATGTVCVWSLVDTDVVVDVEAYVAGSYDLTVATFGPCGPELRPEWLSDVVRPPDGGAHSLPFLVYGGTGPYTVVATHTDDTNVAVDDTHLVVTTPTDRLGNWTVPLVVRDSAGHEVTTTARVATVNYVALPTECF